MLAFRDVKLMSMCWYKGMVSASCQVTRPLFFLVDLKLKSNRVTSLMIP